MDLVISDWTGAAAAAFMEVEWPPYNAALGITWTAHEIVLVATAGVPIGVACGVVVGGLGELKQLLVKGGHARAGAGSRLLEEFERRCAALG